MQLEKSELDLAEIPSPERDELEGAFRRRLDLWRQALQTGGDFALKVAEMCEEELVELLLMAGERSPIDRARLFLRTLRSLVDLPFSPDRPEIADDQGEEEEPEPASVTFSSTASPTRDMPHRKWIGRREIARRLSVSLSAVGNILRDGGLQEFEVRREKGGFLEELEAIARGAGGKEALFVRPKEADAILGGAGAARREAQRGRLTTIRIAGLSTPLYVRDRVEHLRTVRDEGMPLFGPAR